MNHIGPDAYFRTHGWKVPLNDDPQPANDTRPKGDQPPAPSLALLRERLPAPRLPIELLKRFAG